MLRWAKLIANAALACFFTRELLEPGDSTIDLIGSLGWWAIALYETKRDFWGSK